MNLCFLGCFVCFESLSLFSNYYHDDVAAWIKPQMIFGALSKRNCVALCSASCRPPTYVVLVGLFAT